MKTMLNGVKRILFPLEEHSDERCSRKRPLCATFPGHAKDTLAGIVNNDRKRLKGGKRDREMAANVKSNNNNKTESHVSVLMQLGKENHENSAVDTFCEEVKHRTGPYQPTESLGMTGNVQASLSILERPGPTHRMSSKQTKDRTRTRARGKSLQERQSARRTIRSQRNMGRVSKRARAYLTILCKGGNAREQRKRFSSRSHVATDSLLNHTAIRVEPRHHTSTLDDKNEATQNGSTHLQNGGLREFFDTKRKEQDVVEPTKEKQQIQSERGGQQGKQHLRTANHIPPPHQKSVLVGCNTLAQPGATQQNNGGLGAFFGATTTYVNVRKASRGQKQQTQKNHGIRSKSNQLLPMGDMLSGLSNDQSQPSGCTLKGYETLSKLGQTSMIYTKNESGRVKKLPKVSPSPESFDRVFDSSSDGCDELEQQSLRIVSRDMSVLEAATMDNKYNNTKSLPVQVPSKTETDAAIQQKSRRKNSCVIGPSVLTMVGFTAIPKEEHPVDADKGVSPEENQVPKTVDELVVQDITLPDCLQTSEENGTVCHDSVVEALTTPQMTQSQDDDGRIFDDYVITPAMLKMQSRTSHKKKKPTRGRRRSARLSCGIGSYVIEYETTTIPEDSLTDSILCMDSVFSSADTTIRRRSKRNASRPRRYGNDKSAKEFCSSSKNGTKLSLNTDSLDSLTTTAGSARRSKRKSFPPTRYGMVEEKSQCIKPDDKLEGSITPKMGNTKRSTVSGKNSSGSFRRRSLRSSTQRALDSTSRDSKIDEQVGGKLQTKKQKKDEGDEITRKLTAVRSPEPKPCKSMKRDGQRLQNPASEAKADLVQWTEEDVAVLRGAHGEVDPKSISFWDEVSDLVHSKSAEDCRDKWFSLVKTPSARPQRAKQRSKSQNTANNMDDDIFNATPMKALFGQDESETQFAFLDEISNLAGIGFGSAVKVEDRRSSFGSTASFGSIPRDHQRGNKAYIKDVKRRLKDKAKVPKKSSKSKLSKGGKSLVEKASEGDFEVNCRLSPGGTLKMKLNSNGVEEQEDLFQCDSDDD